MAGRLASGFVMRDINHPAVSDGAVTAFHTLRGTQAKQPEAESGSLHHKGQQSESHHQTERMLACGEGRLGIEHQN